MDTPTWLIACSMVITAIATVAIAANAFITLQAMRKNERERSDLYRAMVVSNLLCSPQGDNPKLYEFAKRMFRQDYTGTTSILKDKTSL